jgi:hypothetical protein
MQGAEQFDAEIEVSWSILIARCDEDSDLWELFKYVFASQSPPNLWEREVACSRSNEKARK